MGRESMGELVRYLHHLAPRFFAERMRGAPPEAVARLEEATGTRLSESHRAFLAAAGATPAQALNPFLNDRDFRVDTLLAAYRALERAEEHLPPGIVYFSSSEIIGEDIFLRHAEEPGGDPEIGDMRWETGEFVPREIGRFESWLRWFGFMFRIGQLEHVIELRAPWDANAGRWVGEPERCWKLLEEFGLRPVFLLSDGSPCGDSGAVAAIIRPDGSGLIASDEPGDLRRVQALLQEHLSIQVIPVPEDDRLRAPRE